MDKPTESKALALPRISKFDRDFIHMGGDAAQVYTVEELEVYRAIKAQEERDRAEPQ